MDRIVLRSGLSGFVLLDEIRDAGPDTVTGCKRFERAPLYLGIEALAQLGAFHVRYLVDFAKHAFLLGVKRCSLPPVEELDGPFRLSGKLESRSSAAFSYRLGGVGEGGTAMEGEFLFALAEYDGAGFGADILRAHYRKVFSCLRSGSKTNC
ncbi:MAG: hypothetical protein WAW37_00010 [Syntrophobacteraceae bacterium]